MPDEIDKRDQIDERQALELGGDVSVCDGNDSVHDGVDAAEIGVVAGSQPWVCKVAVWQDNPGVECAGLPIFQTAHMRDGMFGGCGIVPSDGDSAGYGGGFWDEIGRPAIDDDGSVRRRGGGWPGCEESER